MAGVELAEAYVSLIPSAKGIAGKLAAELAGPEMTAAAEGAGEKASSGIASKFSGIGGKLSSVMGIGAAVGLAGIGAAALKIGSDFDDAFDKIRTQTGATGDKLDGLQDSFKTVFAGVPTSSGEASEAIGTLSQRLGLTGAPLEGLSKQVLELSRITGTDLKGNLDSVSDLFVNFGVAAGDQGPKLDELFRVSQATGVSVKDLASGMAGSGAVLRQVGLGFEDSAALIGTLGKAGLAAGDVMPALSKSLATAAKEGKDAKSVFADTFNAIKGAPDDTAAASAAMDVFGAKAGPKLAALVREGKLSYEDLAKSITANGDTIMKASEDTQDFPEKLKMLGNQAKLAFEPLASQVITLATDLSTKLGPILGFITDHMNILGPIVIGVAGAFATYKGVTMAINGITKAYTAIQAGLNLVMNANPVFLVVAAIAALAAGFYLAYTKIKPFHDAVNAVAGAVKSFVTGAVDFLVDHWQIMLAILTGPIGVAVALVVGHFETIKNAVTGVATWVGDRIGDVVSFFAGLPGRIIGALGDFAGLLLSKGVDLITGLINGYMSMLATVSGFFSGLAGNVLAWVGNAAVWLFNTGIAALNGLLSGLVNFEGQLASYVIGLPGKILGWIGDLGHLLYDTGSNIVSGLRDGIAGAWHWVTDKVDELVKKIPGPVRKLLGIESPSKVFAAIGRNVVEGFVVGIDQGAPALAKRMGGMADLVAGTSLGLNGGVGAAAVGGSGAGGLAAGGVNVVVNAQTNADPYRIGDEVSWALKTSGR